MKSNKTFLFQAAMILCFASLAISQTSQPEQTGSWTPLGPFGGSIMSMAQNPDDPDMFYAMTSLYPNVLYRSVNHGVDWTEHYRFDDYSIQCWAMAPTNPSVFYAGGYTAFFKSENAGVDWERKTANQIYFYGLAVDPKDSRRIHGYGQVYVDPEWVFAYIFSDDEGTSWNHSALPSDQISYPYSFFIDPLHPDTLYIGGYYYNQINSTTEPRLFRTMNGGDTWSLVGTGIENYYIFDIVVDPVETNRVYCSNYAAVYRSSDWGSTFQQNEDWAYGYTLEIDPNNRNVLYAGYVKAVFKSTNAGVNWQYYNHGLTGGQSSDILVDRTSSNSIFFSNPVGIFASCDGGENWSPSNDGINRTKIPSLKLSPFSANTLFINVYGDAAYKTTNAMGKTGGDQTISWERLPEFYACDDVSDFEFDPTDPNIIYAFEGGA